MALRDVPPRTADATIAIGRFQILIDQPVIVFGDGGSAKSLLSLYVGGTLAQRGYRVLVLDYESDGSDWRDRADPMFPGGIPAGLYYMRGSRPLATVADDLRRRIAEMGIQYLIVDSIAVACDGPPESADVAQRYFQALRRIGIGSLNVAHITKAGDTGKSFGSAFWSNLARANWYVKPAEQDGPGHVTIALYHRKVNGPKLSAAGFNFDFTDGAIRVSRGRPNTRGPHTIRVADLGSRSEQLSLGVGHTLGQRQLRRERRALGRSTGVGHIGLTVRADRVGIENGAVAGWAPYMRHAAVYHGWHSRRQVPRAAL